MNDAQSYEHKILVLIVPISSVAQQPKSGPGRLIWGI